MKIHEASNTPNGQRVRVFLKEKGIEVEGVEVDLRGGENLQGSFLSKNPFGRIPVLELDDGTFISESVAICRYFEELQPDPVLFGTGPAERAAVEMWNRRAELNFLQPVAQAFRNITGFFKDREKISAEWGQISAEVAAKSLDAFNTALGDSRYLAGDNFSVADISFAISLNFAQNVKLELPFDLPNIQRYREEVTGRPSFS